MTAAAFRASLRRSQRDLRDVASSNVRRVADFVVRDIVSSSPVDTGRFKGNWNASLGNINNDTDNERFDPSGASTLGRAVTVIRAFKAGQVFFFANSVLYARLLESGHSRQAPAGVVRQAIQRAVARFR